ncbi:hypothetical protein MATL_G00211710 [Megalops atlanticus]|uniref:EF-hand domain-containing protein n=1 Tax=Megalops atlanticus TaxID=7932 RepID=A0A9D3PJL3_MEGAT|nr:hypothetical protein MATL_G00211710 [Megalops atlanticus]
MRMEGNLFPDQEQLLQFLKKLKEVFDVCDEDADGFIRVEHFIDLGLQFGQGEDEVKKLAKYLDPNAQGRINFTDFCHGVFAIKGCEEILKTALGARGHTSRPYTTDNGYYYQARCSSVGLAGFDHAGTRRLRIHSTVKSPRENEVLHHGINANEQLVVFVNQEKKTIVAALEGWPASLPGEWRAAL